MKAGESGRNFESLISRRLPLMRGRNIRVKDSGRQHTAASPAAVAVVVERERRREMDLMRM